MQSSGVFGELGEHIVRWLSAAPATTAPHKSRPHDDTADKDRPARSSTETSASPVPYPERQPPPHPLDPDWIDIGDLRGWIEACNSRHGTRCVPAEQVRNPPAWLIDVKLQCIVPADTSMRYCALSYVWGQVECAATLKRNMEDHQRPQAFAEGTGRVIVPKTIRHAMKLVELLGERFLWVDRLCICQDDPASKHSQLTSMADIYAHAYLTIIAANGWDANHGLRGIKGVTEPRQISPNFDSDYFESLQPYSSVWYDRGWTFQELVFSKRKILFQYQVAIWECPCGIWHEGTGLSGVPPSYASTRALEDSNPQADNISLAGGMEESSTDVFSETFRVTPSGMELDSRAWPDLLQYARMVQNYNLRQLTFAQDGLEAFSGVTSSLSRRFPGGFIWGLPAMFFDVALLWQPFAPLKRRGKIDTHSATQEVVPQEDSLPSWSWVGWQGEIDVSSWLGGMDYAYREISVASGGSVRKLPASISISPTCKWKITDGTKLRKVFSTYQSLKTRKHAPVGWHRRMVGHVTEIRYYHDSAPGVWFNYPIPLPKGNPAPLIKNPGHYLHAQASSYIFKLGESGRQLENDQIDHMCDTRYVKDQRDLVCGVLRFHHAIGQQQPQAGDSCLLINISAGNISVNDARKYFDEKEYLDRIIDYVKDDQERTVRLDYEYYNVMWLLRDDGHVWTRGAIGRVGKKAWDSQEGMQTQNFVIR